MPNQGSDWLRRTVSRWDLRTVSDPFWMVVVRCSSRKPRTEPTGTIGGIAPHDVVETRNSEIAPVWPIIQLIAAGHAHRMIRAGLEESQKSPRCWFQGKFCRRSVASSRTTTRPCTWRRCRRRCRRFAQVGMVAVAQDHRNVEVRAVVDNHRKPAGVVAGAFNAMF